LLDMLGGFSAPKQPQGAKGGRSHLCLTFSTPVISRRREACGVSSDA
jgi:hypothetical protein